MMHDKTPGRVVACVIGAVALAVAISGCSATKRTPACPRVSVLEEGSQMTRFAPGPGRDLLDVEFEAGITTIESTCKYKTEGGRRNLIVALATVFSTMRGPADQQREARFAYFVAVLRNGEVINKQIFEMDVPFPGNRTRVTVRDSDPPVSIDIPNVGESAAFDYEIIVGLQLTPEELDYNRQGQTMGR
jgi:hypothetical protein